MNQKRIYYLVVDGAISMWNTTKTTNYDTAVRHLRKFVRQEGGCGAVLSQYDIMVPKPTAPEVLYWVEQKPYTKKLIVRTHILPRQAFPEG